MRKLKIFFFVFFITLPILAEDELYASTMQTAVPVASWPIGNTTQYINPPTLYWYLNTYISGITYEIQCVPSADPWPADNVFATSVSMSFTMPFSLSSGVQYAWRVRSTDGITKSAWSATALFTMVGNTSSVPLVPVTSWPINNQIEYINPPTLSWYLEGSIAGLTFEVQCVPAADPWPADNVFATSSSTSFTMPYSLVNGVQYAWRVRSTNGVIKSSWSATALFTMVGSTSSQPHIPVASWPIGNPTEYTNPPTFYWYLDDYAAGLSYEIQCVPAADPWPADNVFATSSSMSFNMPYSLFEGVQYAWRVRSTNGITKSSWSTTALFTMADNSSDPIIPVPSWPIGNETEFVNPPVLSWYLNDSGSGLTYEIQCVAASAPWPADNVFATSSTTSFTMPYSLSDGVQYAWRVRSTNGVTKSSWSGTALFTMAENEYSGPIVPIPSWPTGNATEFVNPPTLSWYLNGSSNGLTYEIQCVAASAPWPLDNIYATSSTTSFTMPYTLSDGVQYSWRVRSTDGINKSSWSATALFTMAANNSVVQAIPGSPIDLAVINSSSPELCWYLPTKSSEQNYELSYSTSEDMSDATVIDNIANMKYQLNNLSGGVYYWTVKSKAQDGKVSIPSGKGSFIFETTTDIQNNVTIPKKYCLMQNFPNPFNPVTRISYQLPETGEVTIKVFDVLGREVALLVDEYKSAGIHSATFDGVGLPSGIYYYTINVNEFNSVMKMILLK